MSEQLSIQTYKWRGMAFEVETPQPHYNLLVATEDGGEVDYRIATKRIDDLNRLAINLINSLNFPQTIAHPTYTVAVIPSSLFLQATGIPDNYKDWATVCSRAIWRMDGKEDAVITSSSHAQKIDFPTDDVAALTEDHLNMVREAVHEHLPTLKDTSFPYPQATTLPLSEAVDEIVPFYHLGFGKRMPIFTRFRASLEDSEILTVEELWDGFSQHSSDPVATNRAYASALLLGLGINRTLETNESLSRTEALSLWLTTMANALNANDAVSQLAARLGMKEEIIWTEKVFQQRGRDILRHEFVA